MNWWAVIRLRCPLCGKSEMFRGYLDTPNRCQECGFYFMRETGYFLPHAAIAYGGTVLAAFSIWATLWFLIGARSDWIIMTSVVVGGLAFGMWFNRYAKMLWLIIDLKLHPPVREDFERRGRKGV